MRTNLFTRALRIGAAVALLGAMSFQPASAERKPGATKSGRMNLQALVFGVMEVNRVFCGINVLGEVCVDPTNSPVIGGGFWPKGTPNQYIFNSGMQLAGIIPSDAGFDWAGDTTGVFFMDPRGDQNAGDPISLVFNSLDPGDASNWPVGALVRDTLIYNDVLIGRETLSQQDLWVRIWDGNPTIAGARAHPMGILVEERGLGWNFPSGNEDIVYFIYTFYNITASDRSVYDGLYDDIQDSIADIAQSFVAGVEDRFNVDIPSTGYDLTEMYAAFFMDPDVGDAGSNYSTAILPFAMAIAYKADFLEATWSYPPGINGLPFYPAPGFVGVKYLQSPSDPVTGLEIGLSMFSNTLNSSAGFPDPVGVIQMWRYISGNVSPAAGDNNCTFPNPKERGLCFLYDQQADTRFFQSSGPFTLAPGEAASIVVAYIHAAPVAAPLVASGEIGGDLKPLWPYPGDSIGANSCTGNPGNACIRDVDMVAGWESHFDADADGSITQDEVTATPRSLLGKALVAQAVFDNAFLLPFAPEPVVFYPVAGDNQVTVVWQKSATEFVGDPFFAIASVPGPLFDANFREFDVEGYRIYRGRTSGQLVLQVQYDYAGTVMTDVTGEFDYTGNCAPELGITTDCPAFPNDVALTGDVIQIRPGGRVLLSDLVTVLNVDADTAVTGNASNLPPISDTGVPFAFVDLGVRNGFTYHYAVTAFDINSVASGPSSLESARVTKTTQPRSVASNALATVTVQGVAGDDGVLLDPLTPWPDINETDGTFDGPIPPVNTGLLELTAALTEALPLGDIFVRTDSVDRGWAGGFGSPPTLYTTMGAAGSNVAVPIAVTEPQFNSAVPHSGSVSQALVPYDSNAMDVLGIEFNQDVRMPIQFTWTTTGMAHSSPAVATASGRYGVAGFAGSRYLGHSRWYDEGGTQAADPNIVAAASAANNAGQLTGVNQIWAPSAYRDPAIAVVLRGQAASGMTAWYNADFVVTWGAGGAVTVRDVTHNVTLPFNNSGGSGYGFLTLAGVTATGMDQATFDAQVADGVGTPAWNIINYQHLYMTNPTCTNTWWAIPAYCVTLGQTAELQAMDMNSAPDGVSDGNGFVMMINGEYFYFQADALPADGTEWHLQAVSGVFNAECTPSLGAAMTDCTDYTFSPNNLRPSIVPGLNYQISVTQQAGVRADTTGDLEDVHTVPDPYYVTTSLEAISDQKLLQFVNLPTQAIIRIYSVSGILVQLIEHNDPMGGGTAWWDMRNRNSQIVASGVYFYHIETPTGLEKIGRFTIVNFAQ
jgi:hypothetical protein